MIEHLLAKARLDPRISYNQFLALQPARWSTRTGLQWELAMRLSPQQQHQHVVETNDDDDSSGKRKMGSLRHRSALLTGALLVGMCLGVIVSEKLYLITQENDLPEGAVRAALSRKLEVAAGSAAIAAVADGGVSGGWDGIQRSTAKQPKNDLEALLRRIAPQGEVRQPAERPARTCTLAAAWLACVPLHAGEPCTFEFSQALLATERCSRAFWAAC